MVMEALARVEIESGARFGFGENWTRFLEDLDAERIELAEASLRGMLEVDTLAGRRFLDIGSGSGLLSLAARRLGAEVLSFDFDPMSVACTAELKRRFYPGDPAWRVEQGSVLDQEYLRALGTWDIVYSWGVLHHTGALWQALGHAISAVAPGGTLYVAIYNDQGRASRAWRAVKRLYNRMPGALRWTVVVPVLVRIWGPRTVYDIVRGKPFEAWRHYARRGLRGMSAWRDLIDWVGGYPFEVATPDDVLACCRTRGLVLCRLRTVGGGHGCNEYLFRAPHDFRAS